MQSATGVRLLVFAGQRSSMLLHYELWLITGRGVSSGDDLAIAADEMEWNDG